MNKSKPTNPGPGTVYFCLVSKPAENIKNLQFLLTQEKIDLAIEKGYTVAIQ